MITKSSILDAVTALAPPLLTYWLICTLNLSRSWSFSISFCFFFLIIVSNFSTQNCWILLAISTNFSFYGFLDFLTGSIMTLKFLSGKSLIKELVLVLEYIIISSIVRSKVFSFSLLKRSNIPKSLWTSA